LQKQAFDETERTKKRRVRVVATLLLDITKTVGFFGVTQVEFDLNSVAALLTLIGCSVADKVVV
jgi:preprotein translocase subunit SecF